MNNTYQIKQPDALGKIRPFTLGKPLWEVQKELDLTKEGIRTASYNRSDRPLWRYRGYARTYTNLSWNT